MMTTQTTTLLEATEHPPLRPVDATGHWQTFERWAVSHSPVRPERLKLDDYQRLTPEQREEYNDRRNAYHGNWPLIVHDTFRQVHQRVSEDLAARTATQTIDNPGIFLDGEGHVGKTALVNLVAAHHFKRMKAKTEDPDGTLVPVVMMRSTPTLIPLAMSGVAFFGRRHVPTGKATLEQLTDIFVERVRDAGTSLIVIDDLQQIRKRDSVDRATANWLRQLQSRTSATVLAAAVRRDLPGVTTSDDKYSEIEAAQIRRRFSFHTLRPYSKHSERDRKAFFRVLHRVSKTALLMREDAATSALMKHAEELLEASEGGVGQVIRDLRDAASRAILSGEEQFTTENLRLDLQSKAA